MTTSTAAKKTIRRRKMTKVERTQNMVLRAIDKKGGIEHVERATIVNTLQKTLSMTKGQASTYFHNFKRKYVAGVEDVMTIVKL